ncbi:1-phosphatidylinositol 4,5-bisphosphate phosphodiesterase classes I and II [Diaphorina citri]|uniref:1-phosphatidylinositol 4,5-bisphosphate phosphodiesterase classes I and II n=1 Tax=Diaphorina citri TaxID=121845 RepID=A0A3Q0JF90_DIACI|nr:1-phosphatidylinositol 4,5-bisphosphate phosphodiesterase classes I and II [Diaphorina citri]
MSNRLVKRLSTKNLDKEMEKSNTTHQTETSECSESDGDVANTIAKLPRSQSERLLAVQKEHLAQEKDLQEKYHETVSTVPYTFLGNVGG